MSIRTRPLAGALLAAALLSASAGGALAQDTPPAAPPGQARAEGDAILAAAGAGDLFDNTTPIDAPAARLRHKASGLVCEFNPGAESNKVIVFDGAPRGEAVACATGGPAGERVLYATRAPGRSLDQAFAHDLDEVKTSHPDAQDYVLTGEAARSPILSMLTTPLLPRSRTARFIADHTFTSVSSAVVGDWSLEFRYTCPEDMQDLAAGTLQPTLWVTTLAQIVKAPLDALLPKQAV
jgi:hypothetical protein